MSDFHTMITKSGRTFTPLSDYDVLEEIYQDMGQDVHDWVAERILGIDVEENMFNSDYRAMEFECERWHNFVDEMSERIINLCKKIEDNKLTKAKINIELFQIYKDMIGEL